MNQLPSIAVCIGEKEVSLDEIDLLYQRNPFPGGQQYCLRVAAPDLSRNFRSLEVGEYLEPTEKHAKDFFWHLTSLLHQQRRERTPSLYLINSVTNLSVKPHEIVAHGVCSQIVQTKLSYE
jgi:hypothetical protein